ncbi:MAG: hypothetical protein BKP49_07680 [Treponema sp. CETP13]|nr:MAG: hypothetical protein BKP49_07680 [Treponema sp. CETP13]
MENRKIKKLCYVVILIALLCITSCVTNPVENKQQITTEKVKEEPFTKEGFIDQLGIYVNNNELEKALTSFDTIPKEFSNDTDLNYLHASLLLSMGKYHEAEEIVNELVSQDSENLDFLNLEMFVAKEKGDTIKKQKILAKILEKDINNPTANTEKGASQMLLKKYELARSYYLRAITAEPDNEQALLGFGQACYFLDDLDMANSTFQKIVDINPENDMAWAGLGKLYSEDKKYDKAIECAKKAVESEPGYYYHWVDLGNYYRHKGKFDDAIDALNHAVEIDPTYFLAYVYRAGLNDQEDNRKEALNDYKKIVEYKPEYYFAYEAMGVLAWGEKDWESVRTGFYKAYEQRPTNVSYALMVAVAYLKQDKKAECKEFLSKVLKTLDRSSVEYMVVRMYWDNLGDESVLLKVSKLESVSKRGKYYFYLGLWYELQGHQSLAQKYYIQVTEMEAPMFFEYRLAEWAIEKKEN